MSRARSGYPGVVSTSPSSVVRAVTVVADVLRLAVLAGVAVVALSNDVEGAVRFTLVLLILLTARRFRIPPPFDLAACLLLPLATMASVWNWYRQLLWLDWVMHGMATGALAAMVYLLLVRGPLLPSPHEQRRASIVILTTLVGMAAGVVWEFYEWFAEIVVGVHIGVGYEDTIADLAMDTLGSLLAGLGLLAWAAHGHGDYRGRLLAGES